MSHPIFLIDLASAHPQYSPPIEQWPGLAKEHSNHLTRCIRRIITHSNVESVTTHVFDSTVLAQSGKLSTNPLKDALEDLNRIPGYVAQIDTTRVRHPTARGILAGLTDAAPEDSFSEFYPEAKTVRDIYIFARAPATRGALAAFIGRNELALSALGRHLADTPYLSNKFKEFANRGDRLIWVNSTPRRCEQVGDVDPEVERVFSNWLLSFGSKFRFVPLHSFLMDRRIVPAKTMVRGLWDGSVENGLGSGEIVEMFCLQDSQLLRCFTACMNILDEKHANEEPKQTSLVLSGLVRNYRTEELNKFGAFETTARVLTPASITSRDDSEPPNSSIFAGLMVDLARQGMSLVADFFQVGGLDGFTRYQTLLQPITPLSAVLRKVSRTETSVNYNSSCLPQSFEEWMSWDKLELVKDCDITDSAIDASAKFFETYLPTLFSTEGSGNTGVRGARTVKNEFKKAEISQNDKMLLSFEDGAALLPDNNEVAFAGFDNSSRCSPKTSEHDHVGSKTGDRDLIIKQLQAQRDIPHEKKRQISPDAALSKQLQTPEMSSKRMGLEESPRTSSKFTCRRPNQVVAPNRDDIQKCIDVHTQHKYDDISPNSACKNKHKSAKSTTRAPSITARPESLVSPAILKGNGQVCLHQSNPGSTTAPVTNVDPSILQCDLDSGNCFPDAVKTRGSSETKQLSRSIGKARKVTLSKTPADGNSKRKEDALAGQEPGSFKKHRLVKHIPRKGGEDLSSQCELKHGKKVRGFIQAFAECVNKLRREDESAIEAVIWEGVTLLSSLAEALSVHHPLQCDMDRKINLNLKIPKAVSEAVQEVQNKVTNDEFSLTIVLREMWETILSAFEQAMWHLASARRTVMNKLNKKRVNRQVREVSNLLSCVQFMAETASNSRWQPVSFRHVFSKLFSTVFVHLCRNDLGEPIPQILSMYEEYEEEVPTPLQAGNIEGNANKRNDEGRVWTNLRIGSTPHHTQPSRLYSSSDADVLIPIGKDRLGGNPALKVTKKRSKASKTGSSPIREHARKSITKITLGRSQFAKESEALRNAVRSQTRLPLQSKRTSNKLKSQSKGGKQGISNGAPDMLFSQVQDLLANTVPAAVIDKHVTDEPDEDSVEQTPPPTIQNAKNDNVVVERHTTPDINYDSAEHIADAEEGKMSSSVGQKGKDRHRQKQAPAKENELQGTLVRDKLEKTTYESCPNKSSSVLSGKSTASISVQCVNRSEVNQDLAEKNTNEALIDASPGAPCPLTRSQAKRAAVKRRLEASTKQKEHSPTSSGQKKRRRNQVTANLKHRSEFSRSYEASPTFSSPTTRSQAKAAEKNASLQLRNRSLPRRLAAVKLATRAVIADSESPLAQDPVDGPKTPEVRPCTPTRHVFSSEKASPATPRSALSPQTPVAFASRQEESAIRRIVNSSLEKRKGQLEEEDIIPETPVPPKSSSIIPPGEKPVRRMLTF